MSRPGTRVGRKGRRLLGAASALLWLLAAAPGRAEEPAGDWIARMNAALRPGASMVADAILDTRDATGEGLDVRMEIQRESQGRRQRFFLRVMAPEAARGTTYELVEREDGVLSRSARLPSIGRTVDVSGLRRTDSFLGTEFTYEDLGLAAPQERARGTALRLEEDGRTLVRVTSDPYFYYGKVVTFLDPVTALPVRVVFYDRAGARVKEERFEDVQTFGAIPYPTRIEMTNARTGVVSRLVLSGVRFDVPVPEPAPPGPPAPAAPPAASAAPG